MRTYQRDNKSNENTEDKDSFMEFDDGSVSFW